MLEIKDLHAGIEGKEILQGLTLNNFCASTANSIGSSLNTSLQKPLTIMFTASSVGIPRWRQ